MTSSGSSGNRLLAGPQVTANWAWRILSFSSATARRTAGSEGSRQILARASSTVRRISNVGGATDRPSRFSQLLSHHHSVSSDPSISAMGWPKPGRLSNAPAAWASRIRRSTNDSQAAAVGRLGGGVGIGNYCRGLAPGQWTRHVLADNLGELLDPLQPHPAWR